MTMLLVTFYYICMNRFFKFAFSKINGVKVYALVGRSGTGKSYHSKLVAAKYRIDLIIDDGLLIKGDKIIAGHSAKRDPNFIRLGLPPAEKIIHIEDIASPEEIETAMRIRFTEGKHVIPVPSIEITRSYPQIVYDSMKILNKNSVPGKKQSYEKTIVRPEFSRPDKEEISEEAITQMVKHSIGDYDPVIKVKKARGVKNTDSTYSVYITLQLPLRHYMSTTISDLQEYITECLEKFGGILLKNVSIEIEEWG